MTVECKGSTGDKAPDKCNTL